MKKILAICMAVLMLVCGMVSCGASKENSTADYDYLTEEEKYEEIVTEDAMSEEEAGGSATDTNILVSGVDTDRKLIYSVFLEISSQQYDADRAMIMQSLNQYGGYISSEYTYGTKPENSGDDGRNSSLCLRVPIENLEQFLAMIEDGSNVISRQMDVYDTTEYYFDTESRIELLETRYDKLNGYLQEATSMEDIITLEQEMSDILYQLDELKGTKRGLDDKVAYSTVEIELYEVVNASDVEYKSENLGTRIKNALTVTFRGVLSFLEGLLVVLIAALPVLAVLGGIAIVVVVIVKQSIRISRKRKARKQNTQNQ